MSDWDLLLKHASIATMQAGGPAYGIIEDAALAISGERIAWLGCMSDLPVATAAATHDIAGRWLTPALIDCHTHLVFAGQRAAEFEQRLNGASYEEIASYRRCSISPRACAIVIRTCLSIRRPVSPSMTVAVLIETWRSLRYSIDAALNSNTLSKYCLV